MQLHGNAALSVKKRMVLCRRVIEQEWTLTSAASRCSALLTIAGRRGFWPRRSIVAYRPEAADEVERVGLGGASASGCCAAPARRWA